MHIHLNLPRPLTELDRWALDELHYKKNGIQLDDTEGKVKLLESILLPDGGKLKPTGPLKLKGPNDHEGMLRALELYFYSPMRWGTEIFKEGTVVLLAHSIPSNAMESRVKLIAKMSGQRVDWHFVGGHAVVKALGDLDKVYQAIRELRNADPALMENSEIHEPESKE